MVERVVAFLAQVKPKDSDVKKLNSRCIKVIAYHEPILILDISCSPKRVGTQIDAWARALMEK